MPRAVRLTYPEVAAPTDPTKVCSDVKPFLAYTGARVLLFAGAWGLVWLVASAWLTWSPVTALWTALLAMVVSSLASLIVLRGPRARLAESVQARATRMQRRFEESKRREDVEGD